MATTGEEEAEYESDPEEAKRSLTMRRREASDDEEQGKEEAPETERERVSSVAIQSDGESDGRGAPEDYDDEESEIEEEELERVEDEEDEDEEEEMPEEDGARVGGEAAATVQELDLDTGRSVSESFPELDGGNQVEQEKKENEPFAVPTAGAFYMHDDRFRDNARGGRYRRTVGGTGRKLWESKDNMKWGHDKFEEMTLQKFEEMTLQERHYVEGARNSRGRYRARGKIRGGDRGYTRGNKSKSYNDNNQHDAPNAVRGRGPQRYGPSKKNNSETPTTERKQLGKSIEKPSHTTSGRPTTASLNSESDPVPARKQVFASSLSSASPPFYPSGASSKEITLTQKIDAQGGGITRNLQSSVVDENFPIPQLNTLFREKNVGDATGIEKLYISDSFLPVAGKTSASLQLPTSASSFVNTTQTLQPRAHGRGLTASGKATTQPGAPHGQVTRASLPTQVHSVQRSPVQNWVKPSMQDSGQQLGQSHQPSPSPKEALSINSAEPGGDEFASESSNSKAALIGRGKGVQGSGRGSFLYGGAQVVGASGNVGSGHGDQNFAATPAFLPVMPFGGQHPGGIGVPAVGMAFPGYVAQSQLGLGNSEMTWLPVLAGAAGALGATYCPPYIAVDGAYHSHSPASSSGASSKENNAHKPHGEWKSSQEPEVASVEFGQRQKNTRRYTEMNFGQ
ncbi:protein MLN51 homolog isoform X2 [Diospyros lotus]|uniref:protein MLN51 homolog isoform X2 n=1 Tax=Diospyros lotus TaxID=55363 RepID=UPI002257719D|nr:protein MLN51 homolog isoform X2 [Diospyros lotus]